MASGWDLVHALKRSELPATVLDRPMADLGFLSGDIFTVACSGQEALYQIGAGPVANGEPS